MAIQNGQNIESGDWIRATNQHGAVIEGQTLHPTSLGMISLIEVVFGKFENERMTINTNFWDVQILHRNVSRWHTPEDQETLFEQHTKR